MDMLAMIVLFVLVSIVYQTKMDRVMTLKYVSISMVLMKRFSYILTPNVAM